MKDDSERVCRIIFMHAKRGSFNEIKVEIFEK